MVLASFLDFTNVFMSAGAEGSEQEPLAGSSPVRTLDFDEQPSLQLHIRAAEPASTAPLAVDFELPEQAAAAPASPSALVPKSVFADGSGKGAAESCRPAPAAPTVPPAEQPPMHSAQPSSTRHRRQVRPADESSPDTLPSSAAAASRSQRQPQPLDIPGGGAGRYDAHAAVVGSPTTTAPVVAQIRRSRSTDTDMAAELHTSSSGGLRLGPGALVRAVGRALRSVVGGDSDDAAVPLVRSDSLVLIEARLMTAPRGILYLHRLMMCGAWPAVLMVPDVLSRRQHRAGRRQAQWRMQRRPRRQLASALPVMPTRRSGAGACGRPSWETVRARHKASLLALLKAPPTPFPGAAVSLCHVVSSLSMCFLERHPFSHDGRS